MSTGTKLTIAALAFVACFGVAVTVYTQLSPDMQRRTVCALHLLRGAEDCGK